MNTKLFLLIITVFLNLTSVLGQSPNFLMLKREGSSNDDFGSCIYKDADGNMLFAGWFAGTITIGPTTLTSAGYADILLVKYDQLGNFIWAKREGGTDMDVPYSITTDVNGNILVTGSFNSPTLTLGSTTLVHSLYNDMFVAKFDSLGNVIWARNASGTNAEIGARVDTDSSGNVFVVGSYISPTLSFGNITITNAGNNDMYLAKYDSNGNILWVISGNGLDTESGSDMEVDHDGNILVSGGFGQAPMTIDSTILYSNGNSDAYLAKFDTDGNLIWLKHMGGMMTEAATNLAIDNNNNVYITGHTSSDTIVVDATVLINTGSYDIILVKYDANGNMIWARCDGGIDFEQGINLASDGLGNIILVGWFNGNLNVNYGSIPLTSYGNQDILYAKYDTTGNLLWAFSVGGNDHDQCKSVAFDNFGNVITTGTFRSPVMTFGTSSLTNAGTSTNDIYIFSVDVATGMIENSMGNQTKLFPNPFTTETIIQTDYLFHNGKLFLYNNFGQLVKELMIKEGNSVTINRENLLTGIYFARLVENGKLIAAEKLIVAN
jgi:hypothetical protein